MMAGDLFVGLGLALVAVAALVLLWQFHDR